MPSQLRFPLSIYPDHRRSKPNLVLLPWEHPIFFIPKPPAEHTANIGVSNQPFEKAHAYVILNALVSP